MKRSFILAYGAACYLVFLSAFLYAIGFLGNFLVPRSIDSGPPSPLVEAVVVNGLLLLLFGLQHSIMARPTFKRWWTRYVPQPAERSTYVLFSSLLLILLFWLWRPMPEPVWNFEHPAARGTLHALFALGWVLVFIATVQINHFDLFGLRQVWLYFRGKDYTPVPFMIPWLYRFVRHPLYVGWFLAFWSAPTMSQGRLFFAAGASLYILVAIWFEERNLVEHFGHIYADYRRRVPMLIPIPWRNGRQ